jgi:hypothetical protein
VTGVADRRSSDRDEAEDYTVEGFNFSLFTTFLFNLRGESQWHKTASPGALERSFGATICQAKKEMPSLLLLLHTFHF